MPEVGPKVENEGPSRRLTPRDHTSWVHMKNLSTTVEGISDLEPERPGLTLLVTSYVQTPPAGVDCYQVTFYLHRSRSRCEVDQGRTWTMCTNRRWAGSRTVRAPTPVLLLQEKRGVEK